MNDKIKEIIENKEYLIQMKKNSLKHSDAFIISTPIKDEEEVDKGMSGGSYNYSKGDIYEEEDCIVVKGIANTYYWMDHHGDVHVNGCFTKSIQENKNRIYHLRDHNQTIGGKIGKMQDIEEKSVKWSELGLNVAGKTTCVEFKSKVYKDYSPQAHDAYKDGEVYNHSVGMIYINIELAVNDEEYKKEYAIWKKYAPLLGNPDRALEEGYFWVVKEAKLKEISALLWDGSNELTPTVSVEEEKSESEDVNNNKLEPVIETTLKRRRNIN